ncbi:Aste57867_1836 [Aphanomyces stellatus]|uniref:Aste57867_1836 protein n=1 Tax=Aphanomyces stellatus TaxID=120398 RepID=A0A485K625_9STRA|nr:hypothetical protein As57867_001834 [Aphanomyces stellatus]VFT79044.1 Aste57867_1836 [Aphanomyces stellatus]
MHDLCHAVVKHIVGDVMSSRGTHVVRNHLYDPVFATVQTHFKHFPARYACRAPNDVYVHAQVTEDVAICQDTVVAQDRDDLLDAVTRGLSSMKAKIIDAEVLTTQDHVVLDRFIVSGRLYRSIDLRN